MQCHERHSAGCRDVTFGNTPAAQTHAHNERVAKWQKNPKKLVQRLLQEVAQTKPEVCWFDWPQALHKSQRFTSISELLYDFIYLVVKHGCKVCPCTLCSLTSTSCVAATPESGCVGILHKKGCVVCVCADELQHVRECCPDNMSHIFGSGVPNLHSTRTRARTHKLHLDVLAGQSPRVCRLT